MTCTCDALEKPRKLLPTILKNNACLLWSLSEKPCPKIGFQASATDSTFVQFLCNTFERPLEWLLTVDVMYPTVVLEKA